MENTKLTKTNQSVEKAFQLLEIMAVNGGEMRLQDIAQAAGMPPATALRMVHTLECCGYVFQDPRTQMYSLTFKLCRLSSYLKESQLICSIARPHITQLAQRCREVVTLAIESNDEVVFVDIEERFVGGVTVMHQVGVGVPFHIAAVGKLLLLNYTQEEILRKFESTGRPVYTPRTICTPEELMMSLRKSAYDGYAINDEESEIGARCIACPIFDFSGKVYAGMGISGPTFKMTDDFIRTILPVLKDTAARVSAELGYTGGQNALHSWIA